MLDPRVCYEALRARDERFDGRLFVGVSSTGVYCRPVCPARPAKPEHCRFYPSAAAAEEAGFRPCLRCRPEAAPEAGAWRGTSNTVRRGMALISAGQLDGDEAGVDGLAERLGVGARQLRRLFQQHLGASPLRVAQTRRLLFAKQLVDDTDLSMAEIALAAGFGSVRRFNETFRRSFGRPPTALRRRPASGHAAAAGAATGVTLRLRYRPPYDWPAVLSHLAARAVDGIEVVEGESYRRTIAIDGATGTLAVVHVPRARSLAVTIRLPSVGALPGVVARVRRMFDLGADPTAIGAHLARDPMLAPLVAAHPGLRAPGGWDGFEVAARAVLGQQVSVEAGRRLCGRLATLCALPAPVALRGDGHLTRVFPTAAQVAGADLASLGVPAARRRALVAVARAALEDPRLFEPLATVEETVARLCAVDGVGDWTAHYVALRAAPEPDAFPASDAGLLRAAARRAGAPVRPADLRERAERWRPWRAYAAQLLWAGETTDR